MRALFLFLLWMLCRAMEHVCSNGIPFVRKCMTEVRMARVIGNAVPSDGTRLLEQHALHPVEKHWALGPATGRPALLGGHTAQYSHRPVF